MKTIIMTGGGTSGHVTPNIALMPELKRLGYTIIYIGSHNGMEKQLIESENAPYYAINAGKLRRYFDIKNITDAFKVVDGFLQALSIVKKIKPDIVFSKGGFVSCPVVWSAWVCKIPVIIHESDMTLGLTNRLCIPFSQKVCYTFPETIKHIPKNKGVLTGIPIRETLLHGKNEEGRRICGFSEQKPIIMVIGGSQGAESINKVIRNCLETLLIDFQVCHICGKGNTDNEYNDIRGYKQFEYVAQSQRHLYAMADLFVSRAGATTLYEIMALKKPNILIPLSRKTSRGDQILNAESFVKQGFSMSIDEGNLDNDELINAVHSVYNNKEKYIEKMNEGFTGSSIEAIIGIIEDCIMNGV